MFKKGNLLKMLFFSKQKLQYIFIWYPRKLKGFCAWGFSNFYINVNGELITCCKRVTRPLKFGNLKEVSFEEAYKNMEYFRKAHLEGLPLPICEECPW